MDSSNIIVEVSTVYSWLKERIVDSFIQNFLVQGSNTKSQKLFPLMNTVKILKIGTPEIITIIVLQLEQLDFTLQYCVQKMQTE